MEKYIVEFKSDDSPDFNTSKEMTKEEIEKLNVCALECVRKLENDENMINNTCDGWTVKRKET